MKQISEISEYSLVKKRTCAFKLYKIIADYFKKVNTHKQLFKMKVKKINLCMYKLFV